MANKRVAEAGDEVDLLPRIKRPRIPIISSWIVGGLKKYNIETLQLEPSLRKIVREAVEPAIARAFEGRSMPKQIEGPDGRNLVLQFRTKLPSTIFTGEEIKGEGAAIHVALIDAKTGSCVTSGPEAFAKLNVCVLDGDFNREDNDNWTEDEFKKHIVREREGKRPLLIGDLQVSLKEGAGTLGRLIFTDNSSWKRSRQFMLGLKVEFAPGCCTTTRIQEAKTGRFMVKERRVHKKHHPPALGDELWRLECIAKNGPFHQKLNKKGIRTVEDFLTSLFRDPQGLRNIIGSVMSDKNWKELVGHATTAPHKNPMFDRTGCSSSASREGGGGRFISSEYGNLVAVHPDPQIAGDDNIMNELQPVAQSNDDIDTEAWICSMIASPAMLCGFDIMQNSVHSSAKTAVVGWVKIVTALRWAFFIRKKATDSRRAIELV